MGPITVGPRPDATSPILPFAPPGPQPTVCDETWIYDLRPSHALPTLDLSRTLQSEVFPTRLNHVLRVIRRHHVMLILANVVTTSSYFVSLTTPAAIGGYVALLGVLVGIPGNLLVLGQLRYDLLKLLARTFDAWFASAMWLFVFITLAMMLDDLRAVIVVSFWIGSWPNTFHDAVIVTIRPIVIFNIICIFISFFIVFGVNCNTIEGLRRFNVFEYGGNVLPARAAVTDGFMTVAALMARTVYRRRAVLQRTSRSSDLECVIYRCTLQLVRRDEPSGSVDPRQASIPSTEDTHIQAMRFAHDLESVDARRTIAPAAFSFITTNTALCGLVWPFLACLAILFSLASMIAMVFEGIAHLQFALLMVATALTVMNSVISLLLFQRQLVRVMCTSFDFVYVAVQLTSLHVSACDLFEWRLSAIFLASLSWQWILWALLLDAFTPPVKRVLHISRHLPGFIYACGVGASCLLVYMMVFAKNPARTVDSVIWSGVVMGREVVFRVLPQFYSSIGVVFVLMMRYCWRQFCDTGSDLIVIDGAVFFKNSFARNMRSRKKQIVPGPRREGDMSPHR